MNVVLSGVYSLILSVVLGYLIIPLLKRIKAGQTILKYVDNHKQKSGTPTMGGLFFIVSAVINKSDNLSFSYFFSKFANNCIIYCYGRRLFAF